MTEPDPSPGTTDVLFLCTGNICRSPMAEALLRHRLDAAGIRARVHSAGISQPGLPASPEGVELLAARGIDNSAHRSRFIDHEMIAGADLVLAMARRHLREAAVLVPEAFPRCFTLKELIRRGEHHGPRAPGQSLDEWLEKVGAGRTPRDLLGASPDDDVADPIGLGMGAYKKTFAELDGLIDRLYRLIWAGSVGGGE